jgi:F0F1-type ATP synthase assembly protein I
MFGVLAGIGMLNAVALLSGLALGWFLDTKFNSSPLFLLLGLVCGIVSGAIMTFYRMRVYLK